MIIVEEVISNDISQSAGTTEAVSASFPNHDGYTCILAVPTLVNPTSGTSGHVGVSQITKLTIDNDTNTINGISKATYNFTGNTSFACKFTCLYVKSV